VQASRKQPTSAAEKLIDVVIDKPYWVYECFVKAVKQSKRQDVLEMLDFEG